MFAGSQVAVSPSPFCALDDPSTARRLSGSFASEMRCCWVSCWAPVCHAFDSDTRWSICTRVEVVFPRMNATAPPVKGETSCPPSTVHGPRRLMPVRSRARMSLRVSHPLRSTSSQAVPNMPDRSYPVFGALPFTGRVASNARAEPSVLVVSGTATDASGRVAVAGSAGASSVNSAESSGENSAEGDADTVGAGAVCSLAATGSAAIGADTAAPNAMTTTAMAPPTIQVFGVAVNLRGCRSRAALVPAVGRLWAIRTSQITPTISESMVPQQSPLRGPAVRRYG